MKVYSRYTMLLCISVIRLLVDNEQQFVQIFTHEAMDYLMRITER